jgi:hypothetical protein
VTRPEETSVHLLRELPATCRQRFSLQEVDQKRGRRNQ